MTTTAYQICEGDCVAYMVDTLYKVVYDGGKKVTVHTIANSGEIDKLFFKTATQAHEDYEYILKVMGDEMEGITAIVIRHREIDDG